MGVRQRINCNIPIEVATEAKGRTKKTFSINVTAEDVKNVCELVPTDWSRAPRPGRDDGGVWCEGISEEELFVDLNWKSKSQNDKKIVQEKPSWSLTRSWPRGYYGQGTLKSGECPAEWDKGRRPLGPIAARDTEYGQLATKWEIP